MHIQAGLTPAFFLTFYRFAGNMSDMKRLFTLLFFIFLIAASYAQDFFNSLEPQENQIVIYIGSYDWGACVEKIVLKSEYLFEPENVKAEDFIVDRLWNSKESGLKIVKGPLTITNAFCSDAKGNKVSEKSHYITILTDIYPTAENSSPFVGSIAGGVFEKTYSYRVTNESLELKINNLKGFVNQDVARFTKNSFSYEFEKKENDKEEEPLTIEYMSYIPVRKTGKKLPLILWFHGIAESGHNPYQVLFGTRASALATEAIQHYFEDGIAIVAPQCPTGWLETTEESSMGVRYWAPVDIEGTAKKITNPINRFVNKFIDIEETEKEEQPFASISYYTEPITALLMDFLNRHPEIDRDRIYVGGCSAGGYMTINMILQHPQLFAAGFPICEYYLDSKISKSDIKILAEKPLWFTYALNDETVKPKNNSLATIKRLKKVNAKELKVSEFEKVIDTSGKYPLDRNAEKDDSEYGLPYEYDGHSSWIYVMNDQCKADNESLFMWLSRQHK